MSETILVTGAAGFIGTNLCNRLLREGNRVYGLDLLPESAYNLRGLIENPSFTYLRKDVEDCRDLEIPGLTQIYNLACPASPVQYQLNSVKTTTTSIIGVINMLELARRTGARILQSSTSEVYGDPMVHPQREDYWGNVNPIGKRSCYDEGKRCAESLIVNYHIQHGVKTKIIRIFNTYGPYMLEDDGRVISNFVVQALKGEPLTIYGEGEQTRSFQYIDDLLEGMTRMMNDTDDSFIGPVNIGNPGEFTIQELAHKVLKMTGSSSKLIKLALPEDDPVKRCPDISLAHRMLGGWEPKVMLDEGLAKTIEYFTDLLLSGQENKAYIF